MVNTRGAFRQCAIAFEKLWLEAGAPAGAYTNLPISHDQVNRVIDDARIKGVALTGSVEAGKSVAAEPGKTSRSRLWSWAAATLFIVLEDADLDKTVEWAIWAKMNNTGQCCVAAKRLIVVEELADRFLEKFQAAAGGTQARRPDDEATTLGPLSTEAALVQLLGQVERAVAKGATVVMGGKRTRSAGIFHQPTILTNIKPRQSRFREEFFGPVALFFRVGNEDEAVALANDSDFGLGDRSSPGMLRAANGVASRIGHGHGVRQSPDVDDAPTCRSAAIQELGLRTRALQHGIHGICEQKAGSRRFDRCAGIGVPGVDANGHLASNLVFACPEFRLINARSRPFSRRIDPERMYAEARRVARLCATGPGSDGST